MNAAASFLRLLWRTSRWKLTGAVGLAALLSLTEGVSVAMVFPLIALMGGGSAAAPGPRTALLFHALARSHLPRTWWLAALLSAVLACVGLLSVLNGVLTTLTWSIVWPVRQRLADDLYEAILHADWTYLMRRRSSDLTHVLTVELDRVSQVLQSVIAVLSNGMVALLLLGLACAVAPRLTVVLVGGVALLVPWQRRTGRAIYRSGMEISTRMREVFDSSMERLQNLKVVKAFGAQDAELRLFSERHARAMEELIGNQWRGAASARSFQMVMLALLCGVILLGLQGLHLAAGAMLIFLFAFMRATPRVAAVQAKMTELLTDLPAYAELLRFLDECREHSESGDANETVPAPEREIALRGVRFAYPPGGKDVLAGVDLELAAGRMTAVAGVSGAGKSTIADLVMGLLLPQEGAVLVDDVAITRDNARAWRRQIGYVSQDTLLFHDTVKRNLLWAKPEATQAELAEAIRAARAEFVYGLAQGLETVVGDRGMMLSHGQRQRLALARALLLKPALLILDEATSSLDGENEEAILRTVAGLQGSVTTLLISHRPSAMRFADAVYMLEAGTIQGAKKLLAALGSL